MCEKNNPKFTLILHVEFDGGNDFVVWPPGQVKVVIKYEIPKLRHAILARLPLG